LLAVCALAPPPAWCGTLPAPGRPVAQRAAPALSHEERVLRAIQEDAVLRVDALAKRMQGMPEGPVRDALEREALEAKARGEIEFLRAKAEFARARGDLAGARAAEAPPPPASRPAAVAGCPDDANEPNDACGSGTVMGPGTYLSLMSASGNDDWYTIDVQRNGTLTVTISFTNASGDLDLKLFDGCPGFQVGSSTGTTNLETVTYKNTGATRPFHVRVYMYSGACNAYSMSLNITGSDDLTSFDTPPGWSVPIAPRNDATATAGATSFSPTLAGNAASSYFNVNAHVIGPDHVPAVENGVFLDDSLLETLSIPDDSPNGFYLGNNRGPYTVRGGRHTIRYSVDLPNQIAETSDANNAYSQQWIWSPLATTSNVASLRPLPPAKGTGAYKNGDGLSFARSSSHAWVVSEAPLNAGDDYDLFAYGDYMNSGQGFSVEAGNSQASGNHTDFVVGHYYQTPQTVYPSITRFSIAGGGGPVATDQSDSQGRGADLTTSPGLSWNSVTMPVNRLTDVYEIKMSAGTTYYFQFHRLTGSAPCAFRVYPGTSGGVYNVAGGTPSTTDGNFELLSFTASTSGWHPLVVYRVSGSDLSPFTYDFKCSTTALAGVEEREAAELSFAGAVPNPIREGGQLRFALPRAGTVRLSLYDVSGRRMGELVNGSLSAGSHSVAWDGAGPGGDRAGAGVYWARLEFEGRTLTRRIAVVR
jgi:hypothetical protein